ncbi:class I SAM-dependent methyltransferase [Ruixingdingia sedimenti]|uniref:Class I SAM-dependent methyltransferase n=1 Tax=Ruixingdingia sedimenti TaxID=3073604 RepID=A0ABU1FD74_9RHOB|nr:class I SAM-dependent methyltransferase [Xinfangfangia sp. LG-4]MDR5654429.1 class I SAM-dependent methyltransferase [Xinfangfangia sp. LG-4]
MSDPLLSWDYLNDRGRTALMERHAGAAVEGRMPWDWTRAPFNRVALVNRVVWNWPGCRYLEIGCDKDVLFHAVPLSEKTGVDPVQGGNRRMTSDAFFAGNDRQFDVIFIDGLHEYDQIRRDVIHALAALAPGGWILLHDLLPQDWKQAHVPRLQGEWTGDVWKVAFDLMASEGLDFRIVAIDHGVGVVRRKPGAGDAGLSPPVAGLPEAGFDWFLDRWRSLPLIDWPRARAWIAAAHRNGPAEPPEPGGAGTGLAAPGKTGTGEADGDRA